MSVHLLGIRHHGPGSSRHVLKALNTLQPDIVLIEGPPEANDQLSWIVKPGMQPPVALLAYVPDNPTQASFFPFAVFSPEWNALQYALSHHIPVRFIDMPLTHKLAIKDTAPTDDPLNEAAGISSEDIRRRNPMSFLAEIAGFDDEEAWWEHYFELSDQPLEVFDAITHAVKALRTAFPLERVEDLQREAFMRRAIREATKEMYTSIVVICGAWHVPALLEMPTQKEDDELLKKLPKTKVETTWIPWTNERLALESGYGAGVDAPGWYQHVWENPLDEGAHWLSISAKIFRKEKFDISSAHIIESVRLAQALAAMRDQTRPGLKELNEATVTVMCMGDALPLNFIRRELHVGHAIGTLPEGTPQAPLQADLEQIQKKLRLKPSALPVFLTLDLRNDTDLQRSILLHRLQLLHVRWGHLQPVSGKGTFKEAWDLRWSPELLVQLLEKAPWGNTILTAADNYLQKTASECHDLRQITDLVQKALPAELNAGIEIALQRMDSLAAASTDVQILMQAFLPLTQVGRYGNVRKADQEQVERILEAMFFRICPSLPPGCCNINEDQAVDLSATISQIHQSILLLQRDDLYNHWTFTLKKALSTEQTAPVIQGRICKLLYDAQSLNQMEMSAHFSKALSQGQSPEFSAQWLDGFLKNAAGTLLVDEVVWHWLNEWLKQLTPENFGNLIPLLRRTFSSYSGPEKRQIAQKAAQSSGNIQVLNQEEAGYQLERAEKVWHAVLRLMDITANNN